MKFFAVTALLIAHQSSSWAADSFAEVKISPDLACSAALQPDRVKEVIEKLLPSVAQGSPIRGEAGKFGELSMLLANSRMANSEIQKGTEIIFAILRDHRGEDSVLGNMAARFDEIGKNEKNILVCVLDGNCRLAAGGAMHWVATGGRFTIRALNDKDHDVLTSHLLLFNGGHAVNGVNWAMQFLQEFTHFADFMLISDWLNANVALLQRGEMPDELFANYARIRGYDSIDVDEGFLRVFLESRSYASPIAGFRTMMSQTNLKDVEFLARKHAMDDIYSYRGVTKLVVEKYRLRIENIFQTGERWGRTMSETIRKIQ